MKKIIIFLITLIYICSLSITVSADGARYKDASELYGFWLDYGYPDYICGVWSTHGGSELTFGIQNTKEGNAGKQEILDLIENDSSVSFAYQKHSMNYLKEIEQDWWRCVEKNTSEWLLGVGISHSENVFKITIREKSIKNDAVVKTVSNLSEKYGDAVAFEVSNSELTLAMTADEIIKNGSSSIPYSVILGVVLFIFVFLVLIKRSRFSILQTNTGKIVTASSSLSINEVENLISKSKIAVPPELEEKIMNSIDS